LPSAYLDEISVAFENFSFMISLILLPKAYVRLLAFSNVSQPFQLRSFSQYIHIAFSLNNIGFIDRLIVSLLSSE